MPDLTSAGAGAPTVVLAGGTPDAADRLRLDFNWIQLSLPVSRALDYLLRNYSASITVDEIAGLSGRNSFQLIRAFRRELGVTPHALLIRIRVLRATELLQQGEPIAGVAADVGFVDQTHLARHFKRVHGRTPGEYSKMHAGQSQQWNGPSVPTHGRKRCKITGLPRRSARSRKAV